MPEQMDERLFRCRYASPLGELELTASEKGIYSLFFNAPVRQETADHPLLRACSLQLEEYFSGKRKEFDLPLDLRGTDFQLSVWKQLLHIPFGETVSYLHIAKALGDPHATRAVGNANGKNPVSIIVPCHRVIGANGSLVGYGGGMDKKKALLTFERNLSHNDLFNSASLESVSHE